MEYAEFMELFLEAERLEKEKPEKAMKIYKAVTESYVDLVKKCYIGDKDYGVKYRIVEDGLEKKCILDYRREQVEAIAALSNYALEDLEKKPLKVLVHSH